MRGLRLISLTGASLLGLSAPAHAQSADPAIDEQASSNEIIVSARRRDESIQDVPQTVNVVTAEQVEKLNLRSFQDIQSIVPGLTMSQTSSFSSQATVRGIAFVPEASGNNPSVEFYLNDAPISSGFLFQSTFDFGQFELQRGPQGTLRGRTSPSGSIAVTVRRPQLDEVGFVVNGTVTNRHARKVDGALNLPIIADVLAVRVAGVIDNNRGDYVRSIKEAGDPANNDAPFRRTKSIRASVRFEPTDWASVNVMYQDLHAVSHSYQQVVSDAAVNPGAPARTTPLITPSDRLSIEDIGNYGRQDHQVLIGNVDLRFGGQRLSYVGSWTKQDYGSVGPQDGADALKGNTVRAFADPVGFAPVCVDEGRRAKFNPTTGQFYQCTHGKGTRRSHEVRLASEDRIAGVFDYVVGAFFDHNDNPTDITQEIPLPNGVVVARSAILRRGETRERSFFGNLTAHLGDLELSGGLRRLSIKESSSLQVGAAILGTPIVDEKSNATVYLASAKYQVTPDLMLYAMTGSSFRIGPHVVGNFSFGPTGTGPTARESQFLDLPPEKSKSYEVGIKTTFLNGRGRFNLAGYYQTFKNYPFRTPGSGIFYLNYQAPGGPPSVSLFNFVAPVPVKVKGLEGELSFQITDRWSLGVNASYTDGTIKGGAIPCTDLNSDGVPDINPATPTPAQLQAAVGAGQTISVCNGQSRPSINGPKFSANLQSEYGFDVGPQMDGFVRGLYSFSGKTQNDPDNTFDGRGGFGLLNLYAGIRDKDGGWEISAFAKNVTGEREVLSLGNSLTTTIFRATGQTISSQYRNVISMTAPREFGVSARIALGSR